MEPTLVPGDHLLVVRLLGQDLVRGDVVVFTASDYPTAMVKRVIGLPGDSIDVDSGRVSVNGTPLSEAYALVGSDPGHTVHVVPEGHYFLLGDNRGRSDDSRSFGFVPRASIVGRARVVYWSTDLPGSAPLAGVRWRRLFTVIR